MNLVKNVLLLSVLVNGVLLVSSANAQDPKISYSYVEGGYVWLDGDDDIVPGVDSDGDGWAVKGSAAIHPNIFLIADYTKVDLDDVDIDLKTWEVGIGGNYTVARNTSIFGTVAYANGKGKGYGESVDDDGYALGAGVRYMLVNDFIRASVLDGIEFEGGIDYVDLDDFGDDTSFSAGVLFHVNSFVGLGVQGSWGDDANTYVAGIRFTID
jgi:hypothetical protein